MIVDLTENEVAWIQHLADQAIWKYKDDLKSKDKCSDIAINGLRESLGIWDKLEECKTKEYGYGYY